MAKARLSILKGHMGAEATMGFEGAAGEEGLPPGAALPEVSIDLPRQPGVGERLHDRLVHAAEAVAGLVHLFPLRARVERVYKPVNNDPYHSGEHYAVPKLVIEHKRPNRWEVWWEKRHQ